MASNRKSALRRLDENRWELPPSYKRGMRVPGVVYADERMLPAILGDQALEQVANVACLPGIVSASLAMPDIHWGYGFPIGGVAATRVRDGVVSPGGVGFDINCGVRLIRTDLTEPQVRPVLQQLVDTLYREVPSGVGSAGRIRLKGADVDRVMAEGAAWAVAQGYGVPADLETTEEGGTIAGADPDGVGLRPRQRGADQLGTLGAGNHFLEVQAVEEVYDSETAQALGVQEVGQVMVMFHCGSRGFGHQVCQDSLRMMDEAMNSYDISLPDRQLACAPVSSPEGQDYLAAMRCAANYAWANRQCILHWVRQAFSQVLGEPWERLGMHQVYDVAHNIAKVETHVVDGEELEVCVHRKGATRAFPPGSADLPPRYQGWASRCSCQETWAATPSSAWQERRPWPPPLAPRVTARAAPRAAAPPSACSRGGTCRPSSGSGASSCGPGAGPPLRRRPRRRTKTWRRWWRCATGQGCLER